MRKIVLDGRLMTGKKAAFHYLKKELGLPDYTGNNLDAFNDSLGEITNVHVYMLHPDALLYSLGVYGVRMLQVFYYQSKSKEDFQFSIVNHRPASSAEGRRTRSARWDP
ncbi:MAG: barstar family protein [Bacillota bacterium]|nr:barstar family protein [Bacillota bacterium]